MHRYRAAFAFEEGARQAWEPRMTFAASIELWMENHEE